jgi:hypothetical protein
VRTAVPSNPRALAASPSAASPLVFENVLPVLKANTCLQCHGPKLQLKNMDLSTYEGVLRGSESGRVIVAGRPDESRLYQMVNEGKMPPGGKARLSAADLGTIRSWIEAGAKSNSPGVASQATAKVTQHDVIPILLLHCTPCHGLRRQEAGLDLRTTDSILQGSKSGPAILPGNPEQSLLVRRIKSGEMPPKKKLREALVKPVTDPEADKIIRWVAQGAPVEPDTPDVAGTPADPLVTDKDRHFWAFQPPRRPALPAVRHRERVRNPIDTFILSKLEQKGLSLSPEADRLILIRRAYFDLTGLPPEPAEVQAFLADENFDAYDRMIDRLLTSEHYGERWGRYWLDAAGYADSEGGKMTSDDPRPLAWRYRDYVIRSLNADKPYDRFLLEQIAGDELVNYEKAPVITGEIMDDLIATGLLRMAPDSTNDPPVDFVEDRVDVIADEIDVFSSAILGLTMKCARCHSHKYDPIPQRDYYRLTAIFKGAYDEHDWIPPLQLKNAPGRLLPYIPPGATPFEILDYERQRREQNSAIDKQIAELQDALQNKAAPIRKKILDERLIHFPKPLQDDLRAAANTPADKRNEVQKYLAEKFASVLRIAPSDLKAADAAYRGADEQIQRQVKLLQAKQLPESKIRALYDRGSPSPTYILRRGMPTDPGEFVQPGVPSVLATGLRPYDVRPPWPGARSTGRRLALARWLIQPDHPLTARVMVNRIWAHHFGQGIVKSVANFGRAGTPPTNPDLLNWLATEFVRHGWSQKYIHRLILTSSTYRQSSSITPALEKTDPDNKLLSRMSLRRLDAEALHDTIVMIVGKLDDRRFGRPDPVFVRDDGLVEPIEGERGWRRSIYIEQRRSQIPTILESFDFPQLSPACLQRSVSNVATQALHMLNDPTVRQLATYFAQRIEQHAGIDPARQIEQAYWLAFSRPPNEEERKASLESLANFREIAMQQPANSGHPHKFNQEALAEFCHVLMNSAAFLYVE